MADILYKCTECGWIFTTEDGKKPEGCEQCDGKGTMVPIAQQPGQVGCIVK